MPDYEKMYSLLFNATTDALKAFQQDRALQGIYLLEEAQRQAEEVYLTQVS